MKISLKQTNVELTPEERELFEEKMLSLEKFYPKIMQIRGVIEKLSYHQKGDIYRAELTISIPKKSLFVEKSTSDVRKVIEKVKDHAKKMLSEEKKKLIDKSRRK